MIEIREVCKSFNGTRALDRFSLKIEAGGIVGLVGPNGAGKTTLMKMLASLLPADSGEIHINGRRVSPHDRQLLKEIGYLADFPGIYQDMHVLEFLEFFADAFHLTSADRKSAIESALDSSGLSGQREDIVEQLSFGMKQRLLLAKTMLHSPRILLLDEPATGLDPIARQVLLDQLRHWMNAEKTVLISSHILSDLEEICNDVVFIDKGKNAGSRGIETPDTGVNKGRIRVEIALISDVPKAEEILRLYPSANVLESSGSDLLVEIEGVDEAAYALLHHLVQSGVKVCRFNPRPKSLAEDYRKVFGRES